MHLIAWPSINRHTKSEITVVGSGYTGKDILHFCPDPQKIADLDPGSLMATKSIGKLTKICLITISSINQFDFPILIESGAGSGSIPYSLMCWYLQDLRGTNHEVFQIFTVDSYGPGSGIFNIKVLCEMALFIGCI